GKTRQMRPLVRTFRAMTTAKARQGRRGDSRFPFFAKGAKDGAPEVCWRGEDSRSLPQLPALTAMRLRRIWGTRVCDAALRRSRAMRKRWTARVIQRARRMSGM